MALGFGFVILIFSGCYSADKPPTGSEIISTRKPQSIPADAQLLSNLMLQHMGTSGTFAADYEEAKEFNMKYDGSTLRILTTSVSYIFAKTRTFWSSNSGEKYLVGEKPISKLPPIGLLKFLLFSRLVANALHVAPHCRSENERTASNLFTIESFPGKAYRTLRYERNFRETLYACYAIDKGNHECPGIALKVSLAALLSEFLSNHNTSSSAIMQSLPSTFLGLEMNSRKCPSDKNKINFTAYFDQMTTLIFEILRPSDHLCLEQHYGTVVRRLTDLDPKIRPNIDTNC